MEHKQVDLTKRPLSNVVKDYILSPENYPIEPEIRILAHILNVDKAIMETMQA